MLGVMPVFSSNSCCVISLLFLIDTTKIYDLSYIEIKNIAFNLLLTQVFICIKSYYLHYNIGYIQ